jgi:hypothetical protein
MLATRATPFDSEEYLFELKWAGIDIHPSVHWVAVPPGDAPPAAADHPPHLPAHVRSFGTCTADHIDVGYRDELLGTKHFPPSVRPVAGFFLPGRCSP